jgi:hypothetical protein
VSFGESTITREVMQPGWRWSDDVKPIVGTDLCKAGHRLYIASGRIAGRDGQRRPRGSVRAMQS